VPLRAILRVWAGENAPGWAKTIDGPPVTVYNGTPERYRAFTVGHFWTKAYGQAWRDLQNRLAARYDAEPLIAQIANTSCTSADDEPNALARFQNRGAGISTARNLREAGFTDAAFDRCMADAIHDYDAWATTPVNLDIGPLFRIDGAPDYQWPERDSAAAVRLIAQWRQALGARVVLANHTLNYPLNRLSLDVFEAIRDAGGQIEFQTHSPRTLDWANTVHEAVCLGAHALELWNSTGAGGYVDFPTATLIAWSDELKHTSRNALCP
jgi:transposase